MQQIEDSQKIVNRLLNNDYDGGNKEILKNMDLNNLATNLQQINDKFSDIRENVSQLHSLSIAQSGI